MDEFSFLDELQKKREQAQPVQQPVNSLGQQVQGAIDNTAPQVDMSNPYLAALYQAPEQPQQQNDEGILSNFKKGFGSGALAIPEGLGRVGQLAMGTDGKLVDKLGEFTRDNFAPTREWGWRDIANDPVGFFTNGTGAAYSAGNLAGSATAAWGLGTAASAALPAAVTTGVAGMLANTAIRMYKLTGGKLGLPAEKAAEFMASGAGKALVNEYIGRVLESGSEGGSAGKEKLDESGDINEARKTMAIDAALNMGILGASGAVNAANVAGMIGNKEKGKLARFIFGEALDAGQEGLEELEQQTATEISKGEKGLSALIDPSQWSESAKDQFATTALVSPIISGAKVGAGKVYNKAFGNNQLAQNQQIDNQQPNIQQEQDNEQPVNQGGSLVDKVRELEGVLPYVAEDGTNCMRTMGIALAGTPYEGQINVDQAIATAEQNGQLMSPDNYVPQAGDLAVVNDGNHIVMVTENGGTIQNGASHNGVYEQNTTPAEMFGGVKYYIRTSDYNAGVGNYTPNANTLVTEPSSAPTSDYVDDYLNGLMQGDNASANALDAMNPEVQMFNEALASSRQANEIPSLTQDEYIERIDSLETDLATAEENLKALTRKKAGVKAVQAAKNTVAQLTKQRDNYISLYQKRYGETPANVTTRAKAKEQPVQTKKTNPFISSRTDNELEAMYRNMTDVPDGSAVKNAVLEEMQKRGIVSGNNFTTGSNIVPYGTNKRDIATVGAEGQRTQKGGAISTQTQWSELEHRLAEHFKGNPESLKVAISNKIRQLGEDANNGVISQEQYNQAVRTLNNAYDTILPYVKNDDVIINSGKYYYNEPKPKDMAIINDAIEPVLNRALTNVKENPLDTTGNNAPANRTTGGAATQSNDIGAARVTPRQRLEGKQTLPEHVEEYAGSNIASNMVERRRKAMAERRNRIGNDESPDDIITTHRGSKTRSGQYRSGVQDAVIVAEENAKAAGVSSKVIENTKKNPERVLQLASNSKVEINPATLQLAQAVSEVNNENNEGNQDNIQDTKPESNKQKEGQASEGRKDETNQVEIKEDNNTDTGIEFTLNDKQNGIEIKFPEKPSDEIRSKMKAAKYRWSNPKKVWYAKRTEAAMKVAKELGYKGEQTEQKKEDNLTSGGFPKEVGRYTLYSDEGKQGADYISKRDLGLNLVDARHASLFVENGKYGVQLWLNTYNDAIRDKDVVFETKEEALKYIEDNDHPLGTELDNEQGVYVKKKPDRKIEQASLEETAKTITFAGYPETGNAALTVVIRNTGKYEESGNKLIKEFTDAGYHYFGTRKRPDGVVLTISEKEAENEAVQKVATKYGFKNTYLEQVKQAKADLENKLNTLIDDFKEREFASERAVRQLEAEANDKLNEYWQDAQKEKVLNRATIEKICNAAEDKLNSVIKEQLQKAKENETIEAKTELGNAKKNDRLSNRREATYETEEKRYILSKRGTADNPFNVDVNDKTQDIVSRGVTIVYNGEIMENKKFQTLEEAENYIAEDSSKVVESNADTTTKGDNEDVTDSERLHNVSNGETPRGSKENAGERNTGEIRSAEDRGNGNEIPRTVSGSNDKQPSNGRGLAGENQTGERKSSTSKGDSNSGTVRAELTPAQKKNAKAKEHAGHNFTITQDVIDESQDEGFKAKTRFKNNVEAIKLINQLEKENRLATPAEQEILSKYIGWGGLADAFNKWSANAKGWGKEYEQLQQLIKDGVITSDEYHSMERSSLDAFYTPYGVVKGIWDIIERLGFKGGRVLEPSMGTGNFFGIMPEKMRSKSTLNGIEYDKLTGKIAKQLYQKANIEINGFENVHNPENYYDLVISNVPFGDSKPRDSKYNKEKLDIHNYFFRKAVEVARPNGLICFVTSTGTMGKNGNLLRKLIGNKADLIGAIRLPDVTFKGNAGTTVNSDLIILQKREEGAAPSKNGNNWSEQVGSGVKVGWQSVEAKINEYYKNNPDMLIGETVSDRYGNDIIQTGKYKVGEETRELNIPEEISKRIEKFPKDIYKPVKIKENVNVQKATEEYLADSGDRIGSYKEKNGNIYYKTADNKLVSLADNKQKRAKAYIGLRDVVKELLAGQIAQNVTDSDLNKLRTKLNKTYDNFVAKFGYIHNSTNNNALSQDPDYGMIASIERYKCEKKGNKIISEEASKADIFTTRTVNMVQNVTKADTLVDGLSVSLGQHGTVDIPYISKLTGKSKAEVVKGLKGQIYQDPITQEYITADEYLSGNVREKLENAVEADKAEGKYKDNIEALKKIVPKDLTKNEISATLGSMWIPESDYANFAAKMLKCSPSSINIQYTPATGWVVSVEGYNKDYIIRSTENKDQWATPSKDAEGRNVNSITFLNLLEKIMNKRPSPKITVSGSSGEKSKSGSMAALGVIQQIQNEFNSWLWSDKERTERLVNYYNRNFNNYVPRVYNGEHLATHLVEHGYSATAPNLYKHQTDAAWRIMQGNTLLAHSVGAGKTWTMQVAAMEMKRLGLAKKPMFVIPSHMLQQFENEFRVIYPNAKILSISTDSIPEVGGKETEDKRQAKIALRQETLSRIATEDWDGIVISHEMFKRIPMSQQAYDEFYQQQKDELETAIVASKAEQDKNVLVKNLQDKLRKLEEKLKESANVEAKDIVIPFEQLGVDQLFVDEADLFKNLGFTTMMGNVSGLSNSDAQRSTDMYVKTRYLSKLNNGRGVCFATGTPVSNSLAEEFTMLRYLAYDKLKELGLDTFDAWASTFTKQVDAAEVNPSGSGFRVVKKLKFTNGGDLMRLFRSVADVKRKKDLNLKVPKLKNGHRTVVELEKSPVYDDYLRNEIWPRAQKIRDGLVEPEEDNMLKLTSEQRLASLDMRLVKPELKAEYAGAKIRAVADNVFKKYEESSDIKGAQVVFCDLSTPKGQSDKVKEVDPNSDKLEEEAESKEGVVVYNEILKALVAKGIPKNQIAFVHDAKTKTAKEALFKKVRTGEIRVLIGSTTKMGAGTNFQERLVALHHVDAPWRPRDIEQREGRIIRQGNMNDEVEIFTYVTKGSFDESMWGRIAYKSEVIEQALSDDYSIREFEDIGPETLSFADIQAAASGNPLLAQQTIVNSEVTKLLNMKATYEQTQKARQEELVRSIPRDIKFYEEIKSNASKDVKDTVDVEGKNFSIILEGKRYNKIADAEIALQNIIKEIPKYIESTIGSIGNYEIIVRRDADDTNGNTHASYSLKNNKSYKVFSEPTVNSMKYQAMHVAQSELDYANNEIAKLNKRIKDLKDLINVPFAHQAELEEKQRLQADIAEQIEALTEKDNEKKPVIDPETGEILEDVKASVGNKQQVQRAYDDVYNEIQSAFPNAKIERIDNEQIVAELPNGAKFAVSIKDNIILNAKQQKRADASHGTNNGVIQGYWKKFDANGVDRLLAVSKNSQQGTAYHEALHAAMDLALTEKERNSLLNYYSNEAQKQGRDIEETLADAYRDWKLARQSHKGTLFGKLWQKVKDLCTKLKPFFDEGAKVQSIFQDIESGKVYERGINNVFNTDNDNIRYSVAAAPTIGEAFSNSAITKSTYNTIKEEGATGYIKDKMKNFYRDWFDKNDPLHSLDQALATGLGVKELKPDKSIYNRAQTLSSNVAGEAEALVQGSAQHIAAINEKLKLTGSKALKAVTIKDVLSNVDAKVMDKAAPNYLANNGFKNWVDALGAYLGSRRLLEMARLSKQAGNEYKLPNNLTEKQLQDFVNNAPQQFKKAAAQYYAVNDNILKLMENAGLISPELHNVLNTKYKEYCPLMRDFSDTAAADHFIDGITNGGRGIANVSSMLKKISIEGSDRTVFNPLESTVKAIAVAANRCERNRVGQMAVNMVREANGALDGVIKEIPTPKGGNATADAKNMIFTVMQNGKKVAYQLDKQYEELYDPIVGYNTPAAGVIFGVAKGLAQTLRSGATMSPSFIVKNLLRDTIFAAVSSKSGFIPVVDSLRGAYALWKNPKARAEFEAAGVTAFNFYNHKESTYKDLLEMTGERKIDWTSPKDVWDNLVKYPELASEFVESSTRMGEFLKAREKGMSLEEAARSARELTLDFSRSGVMGERYNQYVPFFNACLQGGDKMYRLIKEDPFGTGLKLAKYIMLPSLMLWALNSDEDWYKELDPQTKYTHWFIGKNIKIPKPQEAGILFGSGIEALLDTAANKDKRALGYLAKELKGTLAPNFIPTVFLPIIEWQANYSFFRQGALVNKKLQRLPDEMQYTNSTATISKAVGGVAGLSPVKIDNTVRNYTGTMGMLMYHLAGDWAEDRNEPAKKWNEHQFVRDFNVTDGNRSRYVNEFYDLLDNANKQHSGYGVKGKPNADIQRIRQFGTIISGLNKDIQKITNNKNLSPERKRELIDNKKQRINQAARKAVEKYGDKYLV